VFPRTRNYGTAMAVLVLLQERAPLPARWTPMEKTAPEKKRD
jgi:hypothetical protein